MTKSKALIVAVVALFPLSFLAYPSVVAAVADETMETGTNMKEGGPNMKSMRPVSPMNPNMSPQGKNMETGTNMKEGGPNMKSIRPVSPMDPNMSPQGKNMETGTNMKEGGPNMKGDRTK